MGRPLIPLPGLTEAETRALSRQMRWKLRRAAAGLCPSCGREAVKTGVTLCPGCLAAHRERMRQRTGAVRRNLRASSYAPNNPGLVGPSSGHETPASRGRRTQKLRRARAARPKA